MGNKCVNIYGVLSQGNSREPMNLDGGKNILFFSLTSNRNLLHPLIINIDKNLRDNSSYV